MINVIDIFYSILNSAGNFGNAIHNWFGISVPPEQAPFWYFVLALFILVYFSSKRIIFSRRQREKVDISSLVTQVIYGIIWGTLLAGLLWNPFFLDIALLCAHGILFTVFFVSVNESPSL